VVRADGDRDTITDCNKQLEDMFEFPPGGAVGFNIRDLYSSVEDVSKFKTTIENKDEAHLPLLGYELRVTTRLGKHKTIEVNSRLVHRPDNRILG
jgi:PAS domain-containing protein